MNALKWEPEALAAYQRLKGRLSPLRREQLEKRIDSLREWPPARWFELRNQRDGTMTFQMETDQFAAVLGRFEEGVVYITHLETRSRGRG